MASMGSAQPSGAVTLVFTDIEGSTRLLTELGEERYRALDLHRRQVRACGAPKPPVPPASPAFPRWRSESWHPHAHLASTGRLAVDSARS
jgi:hypothetical protein